MAGFLRKQYYTGVRLKCEGLSITRSEAAEVDHRELVTVEFFGIPRQRAGRADLTVPASTVSELLESVEQSCPGLKGLRQADGRLSPHYLLSLDGQQFVTDSQQELRPGDRLLLLSADAGG